MNGNTHLWGKTMGFFDTLMQVNSTVNTIAWVYILLGCVFVGGIFLTVRCRFLQFRKFGYIMRNTLGKMFKKSEAGAGAVTPFQAVTTALAATVGTGNIVGTCQAIAMGGYGAVFWMWMAALLGMIVKFSEVSLAVRFRQRDEKGDWVGGPMYYIQNGMGKKWHWLAVCYAALGALASFGVGNLSQANSISGSVIIAVQAFRPVSQQGVVLLQWGIGILLAALTALSLFGGIKRIGAVTEKLVPLMSLLYLAFTLTVIFGNISRVGECFAKIFEAAFVPRAVLGGAAGIALKEAVVWGLRRSAFSNEAGLGSAAIAHAASDTKSPVEQGFYGIFEVFLTTIVICTLTALTVIISNVPVNFGVKPGTELVTNAFATVFGMKLASLFVAVAIVFFAFSTILGWALYGARCAQFLFGMKGFKIYQGLFVVVVVLGAIASLDVVWELADTFNGLMAIPNFIGLFALSGTVAKMVQEYFQKDKLEVPAYKASKGRAN